MCRRHVDAPQLMPDAEGAGRATHIKRPEPGIYADPEDPKMVAMLKKAGLPDARVAQGAKGSVVGGIDIVRMRLTADHGGAPGLLAGRRPWRGAAGQAPAGYHWKIDPTGTLIDGRTGRGERRRVRCASATSS
jgi:hypothetical protein